MCRRMADIIRESRGKAIGFNPRIRKPIHVNQPRIANAGIRAEAASIREQMLVVVPELTLDCKAMEDAGLVRS